MHRSYTPIGICPKAGAACSEKLDPGMSSGGGGGDDPLHRDGVTATSMALADVTTQFADFAITHKEALDRTVANNGFIQGLIMSCALVLLVVASRVIRWVYHKMN